MSAHRPYLQWSMGAAGPVIAAMDSGEDTSWMSFALCAEVDPELFYPEKDGPGSGTARLAKHVCRMCPVRPECLEYALEHGERFGIWAGLSPQQRLRLQRGRLAA